MKHTITLPTIVFITTTLTVSLSFNRFPALYFSTLMLALLDPLSACEARVMSYHDAVLCGSCRSESKAMTC
jgi:hypothetical protein